MKNNDRLTRDNANEGRGNDDVRSEKVRELLGDTPTGLVRAGLWVMICILVLLVMAVCLLPYPYSDGESIIRHLL